MEKSSEVYRRNNNGPKTLSCGTPDTTLTSLLQQSSTIICCDRFDRNCVSFYCVLLRSFYWTCSVIKLCYVILILILFAWILTLVFVCNEYFLYLQFIFHGDDTAASYWRHWLNFSSLWLSHRRNREPEQICFRIWASAKMDDQIFPQVSGSSH